MTNTKLLNAALSYASKGWHIFPVTPNKKIPYGSLVSKGHLNATTSADQITKWWTEAPNANIGLNLEASGLVCIDVDSYKPDCGFGDFIKDKHLPQTLTQKSASGGTHYIFKANSGDSYPGTLCKGVDIKYNGYILLSPSNFNGRPYEWQNDLEPAQAPDWLAKQLPKVAEPKTPLLPMYSFKQPRLLEVIANEGWHNTVLKRVGSMVACGEDDEAIHRFTDDLTLEGYSLEDTRAEVQRMIDGARAKGFGTELAQESSAELIKSSRGDVINNHHNVYVTLRDSAWGQVFAFNELAGTKMVLAKPPGERGNPSFFKPREIKDSDYSRVAKWCNKNGLPTVNKSVIIDCVQELCEEKIISPVRHYLEELQFDPTCHEPQLSHWMERYLGAKPGSPEERQYIEAVSRLSLVQAVARALDPGCKADSVPILEGGQGIGKSTAIRVLHGAEWFGDALPPMGTKDASDYLRGLWGIELAELSFQRKAEIEVQKAFISRREERFRPAYGREEIVYPRRCVFWGTTNRTDYIKDDTGNRRFLPIRTTKVDFEGLKASRDMLWAEAVYYYNQGEQYWLSEELVVYANEQTNERIEEDPWVEVVQTMLRNRKEISLKEACKVCFQDLQDQHITTMMTRRMSHCLQMAGWRKDGRFNSGPQRNQARFVKEAEKAFEGDNAHERDCF